MMGELSDAIEAQWAEEGSNAEPERPLPEGANVPESKEDPDNVKELATARETQAATDDFDEPEPEETEEEPETEPAPEPEEGEEDADAVPREEGEEETPEEVEPPKPRELTADEILDLKVKTKVFGEERELPVRELVARAQKGDAAEQTMQRAREMEGEFRQSMRSLLQDPHETLIQILAGSIGDERYARELVKMKVSDWLSEQIQFENLPKQQQEAILAQRKQKIDQHRQQTEAQEAQEKTQQERIQERQRVLDLEIKNAMLTEGLAIDQAIVQQVAGVLLSAMRNGFQLTPQQAAAQIKKERREDFNRLKRTLPPGELLQRFPEYASQLEQEHQVPATKQRAAAPATRGQAATKPERRRDTAPKRFSNATEWRDHLERTIRS